MLIQVFNDGSRTVNIYCEITDEKTMHDSRPFLFVLPGGPGFDHAIYKNNAMFFEEMAHVVYLDPRGCGKSSPCISADEYCIDNYIDDVEQIRKTLKIDKIFILGFSYGSMAALGYATLYSEHLAGLIVVAGAPSFRFLDLAKKNLENIGNQDQITFCNDHLWNGNFEHEGQIAEFFRLMSPLYSLKAQKSNPEEKSSPFAKVNCSIEYVNQAYRTNFWNFDYTNKLKNITCPTMVVYGESDWINDPSFAEIISKEIPNCDTHILKDCGHSVVADQPEVYQQLVKKFISDRLNLKN